MEAIEIVEIKVEALPGTNLPQCLRESMKLAVNEWQKVRLIFNDKKYFIDPVAFFLSINTSNK